jgi:hypothetical protein
MLAPGITLETSLEASMSTQADQVAADYFGCPQLQSISRQALVDPRQL